MPSHKWCKKKIITSDFSFFYYIVKCDDFKMETANLGYLRYILWLIKEVFFGHVLTVIVVTAYDVAVASHRPTVPLK